ncbi:hypothetical protein JD974_12400 [Chromobacterium haemolyticum]|uniref:Lipoprotein n=1 Tax=Chromobacterium haemolyticum TaxID=394935 RepID=A0ABS3GNG3_9NEIS|nr:hypothetical protein [Chromobacterium haemolyticum]MBK0415206.1 hypothetical protein [Chromobacterium haemolyticum]MBO0416579.1 hypothetical protein [Chromobacterium haemolyticum]MBO0499845.1 hypothetical protein [Chromobacterium haemolyticum]BBH13385.1 hypothetical protein CH06BL_26330 [Chromobacterium haemolyticum]
MRLIVAIVLALLAGCGESPACRPTGEIGYQWQLMPAGKVYITHKAKVERHECTDGVDRWWKTDA